MNAAIIGPRACEQLTATQPALDFYLSDGALRRLDGIRPGPASEVPEAYGW